MTVKAKTVLKRDVIIRYFYHLILFLDRVCTVDDLIFPSILQAWAILLGFTVTFG